MPASSVGLLGGEGWCVFGLLDSLGSPFGSGCSGKKPSRPGLCEKQIYFF